MKKKIVSFFASVSSLSLRRKLLLSITLMAIFPLLVYLFLISHYTLLPSSSPFGLEIHIAAAIVISVFIAIMGFWLVKGVFDRISSVSTEAKLIAAGDIEHKLEIGHSDEIGDLSDALNHLTQRIRENMDELKGYGEKTTQINLEIQKRVLMLSGLLQVSSLISQGVNLEDILKITVEKLRLLAGSDTAYLLFRDEGQENFYMKAVDGLNADSLLEIQVQPRDNLFDKVINMIQPLILDKQNMLREELATSFYERFKLKNTLALPIYLKGKVVGILGIGGIRESFLYSKGDMELLDLLTKQVAIAVENNILSKRLDRLEVKDTLTGLYNKTFIYNRLHEEIKRAIVYQRPCALVIIDVDNFNRFHQNFGLLQAESGLRKIASLIGGSVTEIDRVARTGDDEFAIVLPEKNKRKAQDIAEDIRKKIEFVFSEEQDVNKRLTVSGGVSENPLDGIEANELIRKSEERLCLAKKRGRNCIVG